MANSLSLAVRCTVLALLSASGLLLGQEPPPAPGSWSVASVEVEEPVTVDGRLDDWSGAPTLRFDQRDQVVDLGQGDREAWGGPQDLSAELWVAHDAAHLYVAGRVVDDELVTGQPHDDWHRGDAIEVFLDLGPLEPAAEAFDEQVLQLFLKPFSERRSWGLMDWSEPTPTPRGANLVGIEFRYVEEEATGDAPRAVTFEASIPFHNFPAFEGREAVRFAIALDDHDSSRPDRYQYMTIDGRPIVDHRSVLGTLRFTGVLPQQPRPVARPGALDWLSESGPWIALPLLGVLLLTLLLYGWSWLNRVAPAFRPLGRLLGVAMCVVGLALPGWLERDRREERERRLAESVATLRGLLPELRGSILDGYRGGERDQTLLALLRGGAMQREKNLRYKLHADVAAPGGEVLGVRPVELAEFGLRVRDYGIPLSPGRVEVMHFRDVLGPGTLIVVLARPLGVVPRPESAEAPRPDGPEVYGPSSSESVPQVRLAVTTFVAAEAGDDPARRTHDTELDFTGAFEPASNPAFERLEIAYATVSLTQRVESVGIACRAGADVRLVGLTWQPFDSTLDEQIPLTLGKDTLAGVPTDLRDQYPRDAGYELPAPGGRPGGPQTLTVELDPDAVRGASRLWLVYHGVYRKPIQEPLGPGSRVCEVTIDFEGGDRPPLVVGFEHRRTMLFSQERYNLDLPDDEQVRIAHRWIGDDQEARIDLLRRIDLPPGATPVRLHFRNTGPYGIRFRSLVFGEEIETVLLQDRTGPARRLLLSGERGVQRLSEAVVRQLTDLDFGIYRSGRMTAATGTGPAWDERAVLPEAARRLEPGEESTLQSAERPDGVVYEAFLRLRGEAWSDAMLGVFLRDPGHHGFLQRVNQLGWGLVLGSLPVLLLVLSELLGFLNSLRVRLVVVLTAAALLPLLMLSVALVRVLEKDHEQRLEEGMTELVGESVARIDAAKAQLRDSVESWLGDLVSYTRARLGAQQPSVRGIQNALQQRLRDQLPPAWGDSGFLRFEFSPAPERAELTAVSAAVGAPDLRDLETQLRADAAVQLVWGVPLMGVRLAEEDPALGTFALSAGRRLDADLLSGGARERAVLLCSQAGYPVAVAGEQPKVAELRRHAERADVTLERARLIESLALAGGPVVRRHDDSAGRWLCAYELLRGAQGAPRLLLAVARPDLVATLPLAFGRVPVRAFFVGVAGVLLLFAVFLSYVVTARISTPIERLERGAQALRAGRFDVHVDTEEGGQIGRLTRTFNDMAAELRGRIDDLRLMNRSVQELQSRLELDDVLATVTALFARHSSADAVRVLLVDRERDRVVLHGGRGEVEVDRDDPLVAVLLAAEGPLSAQWGRDDPSSAAGSLVAALPGLRSLVALPLIAAGRSRGLVLLLFEAPQPGEVPLELVWVLATQSAAALENARLYHRAVEDVYTGALRSEFFMNRVVTEVAAAGRDGRSLGVCGLRLVDGDAIAGALGREALGRLMEALVALVRDALGSEALICRSGDTELLALLREGDRAALDARLRDAVERVRELHAELPPRLVPLRATGALAMYPSDAASAEFLLDAVALRLAPGGSAATGEPAAAGSRDPGPGVASSSPAMRALVRTLERVAPTDLTILLVGETGTGKEVLADLIHRWSERSAGPLVKVHCAALPETLLQSELFGHEKGAFTGAVERRIGRFEQAEGGTIFLDEIGEISPEVQVKLLRVLQEREIDRVGGSRPVPVDVRVVAATNRDVEQMVAAGRFREDLYYRLQGMLLRVPPLRERKQEIPGLVELFRQEAVRAGHTAVRGFSPEAMDWLYRQRWPGNIRELRNAVFRAMVLAQGEQVERSDLAGGPHGPTERVEAGTEPPAPVPAAAETVHRAAAPAAAGDPAAPDLADLTSVGGVDPGPRDPRGQRVLEWVRQTGVVTTTGVSERLGVSPRTALRILGELVDAGVMERVGKRRGASYRAREPAREGPQAHTGDSAS
ncbi:MAG: sigma 54-interacting transcriptional regulator [Planctomycetes bacterium]|nr:sigma 54-interacting transcriptional regulator [Planctomycetota bacterium]